MPPRRLSSILPYASRAHTVGDGEPLAQKLGGFVWSLPVKGHQRCGATRCAGNLGAPLAGADIRDFDDELASVDALCKPMYVHVSPPPLRCLLIEGREHSNGSAHGDKRKD